MLEVAPVMTITFICRGSSHFRGSLGARSVARRRPSRPRSLVRDHDLGGSAGEQIGERLVLVLVGQDDRVAEWQSAGIGEQDETDAPDAAVLGTLVAVAGRAGELAPPLA
jgi:hypothetical protein